MNELIFITQIFVIISFAFGALKLGKEALMAWVTIQALLANLFVIKQIELFSFTVTASDAFAIGSLLGLNFLQEYFGKEEAKRATWICFFFMIFFTVISQIHLMYLASPFDQSHDSFSTILSHSPRLMIASLCVFFIVQQIDIRFFSFLKKKFFHTSFALRATLALVVSQFIDTFLFSFAGLYGIVASLFDIIFVSFVIKLITIFCFTPLLRWAKT